RLAGRASVGLRFLRQCLSLAGAYVGLRHCGAVSGGVGIGAGGGDGECRYVASAFVEGRRGGSDRRAADHLSFFADVAVSWGVVSSAVGGERLCRVGGFRLKR